MLEKLGLNFGASRSTAAEIGKRRLHSRQPVSMTASPIQQVGTNSVTNRLVQDDFSEIQFRESIQHLMCVCFF